MADAPLPSRKQAKAKQRKVAPAPIAHKGGKKPASHHKRPQAPGVVLRNTQVHAEIQQKRSEALALRIRGMPVTQIATLLKVEPTTVYRYISDALKEIPRDNAEEALKLELEKLDRSDMEIAVQLQKENLKHADRARYLQTRARNTELRCRLKGLFAPERHEHSLVDRINASSVRGMTEDDLRRIAAGDFSQKPS